MAGKVISGDDPTTRGNIARNVVLIAAADSYRDSFNWGLSTFETPATDALQHACADDVGNATTMVYT